LAIECLPFGDSYWSTLQMGEHAPPSYLSRQAIEIDRRNEKTKMSITDLMQKVQKNRRKQAQGESGNLLQENASPPRVSSRIPVRLD
jgi:hypothetical protein